MVQFSKNQKKIATNSLAKAGVAEGADVVAIEELCDIAYPLGPGHLRHLVLIEAMT